MVCMSIVYQILLVIKIVMLQKIRKNKEESHKWGHFLEIRTVIFSKTYYRNKDGMVALVIGKSFLTISTFIENEPVHSLAENFSKYFKY